MELNSLSLAMLVLAFAATLKSRSEQLPVAGWIEEARLYPGAITLKAKLDTGALTSSLDARDIRYFRRASQQWVRFRVVGRNRETGESFSQEFERPLVRRVRLRGAGGVDHRPVVTMEIGIGQQVLVEEFSLRDRKDMLYPLLLGRRTLARIGPVDTRRTFAQSPRH
ncbi:hypothetical protein A6723_015440 [Pseudomonas sp. AU11447]|uniref:ATP-dependent zinc protease family protein n=1 Tax=unclassified Pseudomonas TaxID=196821 RepID=UPI0006D431B3|nr:MULTISPECIES: RimK/LysX family protein [unclassified Pseudomonas]OBY92178.1 hypothetical protein A6723_015440 [Pseudomonas sp. AU11447]